jgi:hypothetical protein
MNTTTSPITKKYAETVSTDQRCADEDGLKCWRVTMIDGWSNWVFAARAFATDKTVTFTAGTEEAAKYDLDVVASWSETSMENKPSDEELAIGALAQAIAAQRLGISSSHFTEARLVDMLVEAVTQGDPDQFVRIHGRKYAGPA